MPRDTLRPGWVVACAGVLGRVPGS